MANLEFKLSLLLRHAFLTGAGYSNDETKLRQEDHEKWVSYEPPMKLFDEVVEALTNSKAHNMKGE